jgi:hypothetical protein
LKNLSVSTIAVITFFANIAFAQPWTLTNPTGRTYENEVVRLKVAIPTLAKQGDYRVEANGKEVPCQVGDVDGKKHIFVAATLGEGERIEYEVKRGKPRPSKPLVQVKRDGNHISVSNGRMAVRLPATAGSGMPGPIEAVRIPGGKWVGASEWTTDRSLKSFSAEVLGDGTIFGKVRLRYEFEAMAGLHQNVPAFAIVDVSLLPGQSHVVIEEAHEMARGDYWEFDATAGWGAKHAICVPHSGGFERPDLGPWPPNSLKEGQTRMGDTVVNLMPRWSQAYDEGWFFAAHDGKAAVGAMVVRAGSWHWPHNNMIEIKVKKSADYCGLRCPTWKGRRVWFLVAGPSSTWADEAFKGYVTAHAFQPLGKLHHDYILDWPGLEKVLEDGKKTPNLGKFSGKYFFDSGMNPTGAMRGFGKNAVRNIGKQGNIGTLTQVQVLLDNDCYGSYWNYWSSENPNFFTDFVRGPIAMTTQLTRHPRFKELAAMAERKFREDLYHSITLPGGAGQECPGYVAHAMHAWTDLAPACKQYLGFDPTKWPRFKAGASFLVRLSQPISPGQRRCHPGGDTHPMGPDVFEIAKQYGVKEDVKKFRTEELPGFGVVFRNNSGTDKETYLAFKSGPNRGHYHGDQLSFHYCSDAKQVAIDHMCSYGPRAGQEHMHNRLAFHTQELPFANMDGFERVIAMKTSSDVDVAIGQVESERLRFTTEYPPEGWDVYLPEQKFDTPLKYRRTIVQLKNVGKDYFVVRDQYAGPSLNATYCLHVLSNKCERNDNTYRFGNLTLFVASPTEFEPGRHDWNLERNTKSGTLREHTKGVRLTVEGEAAEFITVLYPGDKPPKMEAIEGGVRVGDDEVVFAGAIDELADTNYATVTRAGKTAMSLTGKEIDLDRSQGEIGLFVPDAGYPFGEIPDWLIRQRSNVPDWAPDWVKAARKHELE